MKNRWETAREASQNLKSSLMSSAANTVPIQAQKSDFVEVSKNQKIYIEESDVSLQVCVKAPEPETPYGVSGVGMLITLLFLFFLPWLFFFLVHCLLLYMFCFLLSQGDVKEIRFRQFGHNWLLISPNEYSVAMKWKSETFEYQQFQDYPLVHAETRTSINEIEKLYLVTSSGNSLRFAGELDSEEAVWLARRINVFLDKQRAKFPPVDLITKMPRKANP